TATALLSPKENLPLPMGELVAIVERLQSAFTALMDFRLQDLLDAGAQKEANRLVEEATERVFAKMDEEEKLQQELRERQVVAAASGTSGGTPKKSAVGGDQQNDHGEDEDEEEDEIGKIKYSEKKALQCPEREKFLLGRLQTNPAENEELSVYLHTVMTNFETVCASFEALQDLLDNWRLEILPQVVARDRFTAMCKAKRAMQGKQRRNATYRVQSATSAVIGNMMTSDAEMLRWSERHDKTAQNAHGLTSQTTSKATTATNKMTKDIFAAEAALDAEEKATQSEMGKQKTSTTGAEQQLQEASMSSVHVGTERMHLTDSERKARRAFGILPSFDSIVNAGNAMDMQTPSPQRPRPSEDKNQEDLLSKTHDDEVVEGQHSVFADIKTKAQRRRGDHQGLTNIDEGKDEQNRERPTSSSTAYYNQAAPDVVPLQDGSPTAAARAQASPFIDTAKNDNLVEDFDLSRSFVHVTDVLPNLNYENGGPDNIEEDDHLRNIHASGVGVAAAPVECKVV
ncbi:unnamed protein product, partial [Amoebophrya sp. A25]